MRLEFERRSFLAAVAAAPIWVATDATASEAASGWPKGSLWRLPSNSGSIALTVDDGLSYDTVARYVDFVE